MTKSELRRKYLQWAAEEIEAIELIEAVGKYLGNPQPPSPATNVRVTEAMVNAADSVLSRRRPGIPDETIRLAIIAALAASTEGSDNG